MPHWENRADKNNQFWLLEGDFLTNYKLVDKHQIIDTKIKLISQQLLKMNDGFLLLFYFLELGPGGIVYDSDSSLTLAAAKSLSLSNSLSKQCGLELDQQQLLNEQHSAQQQQQQQNKKGRRNSSSNDSTSSVSKAHIRYFLFIVSSTKEVY